MNDAPPQQNCLFVIKRINTWIIPTWGCIPVSVQQTLYEEHGKSPRLGYPKTPVRWSVKNVVQAEGARLPDKGLLKEKIVHYSDRPTDPTGSSYTVLVGSICSNRGEETLAICGKGQTARAEGYWGTWVDDNFGKPNLYDSWGQGLFLWGSVLKAFHKSYVRGICPFYHRILPFFWGIALPCARKWSL